MDPDRVYMVAPNEPDDQDPDSIWFEKAEAEKRADKLNKKFPYTPYWEVQEWRIGETDDRYC